MPGLAALVLEGLAVSVRGRVYLLDGEQVAGVETEVAAGGSDDEAVARGDEDLAGVVVACVGVVAGDGDRDFAGALFVREGALTQGRGERADLVVGCAR